MIAEIRAKFRAHPFFGHGHANRASDTLTKQPGGDLNPCILLNLGMPCAD